MLKAGQRAKRAPLQVTAAYGVDDGKPRFHVHGVWAAYLHQGDLVKFIGGSLSGVWAKTWQVVSVGSPIDGRGDLREVYVTEVQDW